MHLSMVERRLGKRASFFQETVVAQPPWARALSEQVGAAFGTKFSWCIKIERKNKTKQKKEILSKVLLMYKDRKENQNKTKQPQTP